MGLAETGGAGWVELGPFAVGLGEDAGGGFEEVGIGAEGVLVGEVVVLEVWGWWDGERGVEFLEKEAVGEIAEATEVVDGEG